MASPNNRKSRQRTGLTIIEITTSLAVLGVACVSVAKLAATQSKLNRQHEMKLVATLQVHNAIQRLGDVSYDDLSDKIKDLERDSAFESLRFNLQPFELEAGSGLHLRIDAIDSTSSTDSDSTDSDSEHSDSTRVLASEHLWRVQHSTGVSNANE